MIDDLIYLRTFIEAWDSDMTYDMSDCVTSSHESRGHPAKNYKSPEDMDIEISK